MPTCDHGNSAPEGSSGNLCIYMPILIDLSFYNGEPEICLVIIGRLEYMESHFLESSSPCISDVYPMASGMRYCLFVD